MNIKKNYYTSNSIKMLKGLDAVRKRPGMYIGDISNGNGLHHMIFEIIDNSIDEALSGYCNEIIVKMNTDNSISIIDNGRGIPVEIQKDDLYRRSAAEIVMTELHAGGKFDQKSYKISGGLHGLGLSCVNALSKWLKLNVRINGKNYQIIFSRGKKLNSIENISETKRKGTEIRYLADSEIFSNISYNYCILFKRLKEISFLNSGIKLTLINEKSGKKEDFSFLGGIKNFVRYNNNNKKILNENIFFVKEEFNVNKKNIIVEVAMQWNSSYIENILCFTNNIPQLDGGTHMTGLKTSLTRIFNKYIIEKKLNKKYKVETTGDDIREGLNCVISIKTSDPKFSSQTKNKLISFEVRTAVEEVVSKNLELWLIKNTKESKILCNKIIEAANARETSKKAKEITRRKNAFEISNIPGKLSNCQDKNPSVCEIYIVEGDSAGGSAKQGRDRKFQAILPLRGKLLNVEKSSFHKLISSEQITTLIKSLGTGIGKNFNIEKLRYHKIIIMTDADIDGSHIRTLLLTLIYRQMPQLFINGFVYVAQPPLYKIKLKNNEIYLRDNIEEKKFVIKLKTKNIKILTKKYFKYIENDEFMKITNNIIFLNKLLKIYLKRIKFDILLVMFNGINIIFDSETKADIEKNILYNNLVNLLNYNKLEINCTINKNNKKVLLNLFSLFKNKKTNLISFDNKLMNIKYFKRLFNISNTFFKDIGENSLLISNNFKNDVKLLIKNLYDILIFFNLKYEKKLNKQRYKGLGEMNPNQLWETTMNPKNRRILKVKIKDAFKINKIFNILMGENVEKRKSFIKENSLSVNNLDI